MLLAQGPEDGVPVDVFVYFSKLYKSGLIYILHIYIPPNLSFTIMPPLFLSIKSLYNT